MINADYIPDGWEILLINKNLVKVFGSWYGGWNGTDNWRLNSGTIKIEEDEHYWYAHGYSGSIYALHKECQGGISMYNRSILSNFLKENVEIISPSEAIEIVRNNNEQ